MISNGKRKERILLKCVSKLFRKKTYDITNEALLA